MENTHEPIIDRATFDKVQRFLLREHRIRREFRDQKAIKEIRVRPVR